MTTLNHTTCVEAHLEHFRMTAALRARCVEFALLGAVVFCLGYQAAQLL